MKSDRHVLGIFFITGVVALAVSLGGIGCAYYNTFYNAKRIYREAQETPTAKDGTVSRAVKDKYDEVITRCEVLIQTYPTSKYVDDAILLIGKCLYEQEEYDDALVKFTELQENFPDSKLNNDGQLYAAKCYIAKEEDDWLYQPVFATGQYDQNHLHGRYVLCVSISTNDRAKCQ